MKCYLCGDTNNHPREGKVRDDHSIKILECNNCGLVFLDKQDIDEEFYQQNNMLNEDFFKHAKRSDGNPASLQDDIAIHEKDWKIMTARRVELLRNMLIGKNILDFGSGHAQFLMLAKEYAKNVAGIEIEEQVESIYKNNGITLYRSIEEANMGGGGDPYDIVTAFHVIEHLQDPITILQELTRNLKQQGKIIIEVPNANDALLTIYQNKSYMEFIYTKVHLKCYTPHTLALLGKKAGFKVDFVRCIQRYPLSNTLYWLSNGAPAGHKHWGNFIDNKILQESYESTLSALGATDTLIAQFTKI